ncbi:MAG: SMP-30/gluconolactonase/LRE family protein [Myxococcales bacterium]|nr:SMP-30/gluconolactonase/LRE family protein [Myxococcales bacterium]
MYRTVFLAALLVFTLSPAAPAWNRSPAVEFAVLPQPLRHPEGLTVDRLTGDFYVSDFDYQGTSASGRIAVFARSGRWLRTLVLESSPALLGLDFHPITHQLLVLDFGAGKVLRVDPVTGATAVFAVPADPSGTGLNALTFDAAGNVYVSDSFRGIIWKTGAAGGTMAAWVTSPLLLPNGVPPFGANGLAFNSAGVLFVANTANDTVVQIPVANGIPGSPTVFVNSINGADGLIIDEADNLWVAANQADEIVVVDPSGKAIAKLGDFDGIAPDNSPVGLLFPASPVFFGEFVYVTNLALDLRDFNPQFNAVDSQYTAEVTTWNVARISRHLPPVHDRTR